MSLLAVGYLSSFLERADHCQRGTAQHAYMLACESGLIGGLTLADVMPMEYSSFAESLIIMLAILSFLISKHRNQKKN